MLIMDQRTMQIKYRIPAAEIFKLSLSPYHDDIAVFHVRAVSFSLKKGLKVQIDSKDVYESKGKDVFLGIYVS